MNKRLGIIYWILSIGIPLLVFWLAVDVLIVAQSAAQQFFAGLLCAAAFLVEGFVLWRLCRGEVFGGRD